MFQTLRTTRTSRVTAASTVGTETAVNRFAAAPARQVVIQATSGNAGTVTVLGVDGDTADTQGIVLAAGASTPVLWVEGLAQLAYQFSSAADSLKVLRSY